MKTDATRDGHHARRREGLRFQRGRRHRLGHRPAAWNGEKEITVGRHLSHPEGMATHRRRIGSRCRGHQDLVRVINTKTMEEERALSVERPQHAPVAVSVTPGGRRLIVSNSGEDAIAVFALPGPAAKELAAGAAGGRRPPARGPPQCRTGRDRARGGRRDPTAREAEEEVEAEKAARPVKRKPSTGR